MPHSLYTYRFADLMTNTVNLELPLYGVWFTRQLNGPGNCNFSFMLDSGNYPNADVLAATEPGKTVLYIDRGGSLVWGGIVWSRTYQSQAKSLSYTGQTFESFLAKQFIEENLTFTNVDQRNILIQLVEHMQAKPFANIGIEIPEQFETDNIVRTVNFTTDQVWTYARAIEYMIEFDEGFDFSIPARYGGGNTLVKNLEVDDELGTSVEATQLAFDYPGNIKNYYFPESAGRAAVTTLGFGAGEGAGRIRSKVVQSDMYGKGYPDLQAEYTNTDVSKQSTLDTQTAAASFRNRPPVSNPTFEVNIDKAPHVGSFRLGDHAHFDIEDPRFPEGKRISTRIVGWEINPNPGGGEAMKLIIPGGSEEDM